MQYFEKALLFAFGKRLHALFTILLIHRKITDANAIWNIFATDFCNNLSYQLKNQPNIPENMTNPYYNYNLYLFGKLLKESRKILD